MDVSDRFWPKVEKTDSCWLWRAALGRDGYGRFGIGKRSALAHRVAYELKVGAVPDGMFLDHLCHIRRCVNPSHLRPTDSFGNGQNRRGAPSNSSTGIRGVTQVGLGRFQVQVKTHRRNHYIGTFGSLESAEAAAIAARERMFEVPGRSR